VGTKGGGRRRQWHHACARENSRQERSGVDCAASQTPAPRAPPSFCGSRHGNGNGKMPRVPQPCYLTARGPRARHPIQSIPRASHGPLARHTSSQFARPGRTTPRERIHVVARHERRARALSHRVPWRSLLPAFSTPRSAALPPPSGPRTRVH